jgi:hypothetical protein
VNLSPDSTTYITASANLLRTGRLFYFVNAASWSMEPEVEPYTEQPPGFVYYLAPFVAIFGEPMLAALVAQSVVIVLFYVALFLIVRRLGLVLALRISAYFLFAFLAPFVGVRSFLWSETLFIAVSIGIGWIAIRLLHDDWRRSDWLWLLVLLAASSAIRLVGVANIAWILPILVRRRHIRAGVRLLAHRLVYSSLALGGLGLAIFFLVADSLGLGSHEGIGPTQLVGIGVGTTAALLGVGIYALVRTSRIRPWSGPADAGVGGADLWPVAAIGASFLPVALWFVRNEILVGAISLTNKPFEVFYPAHLGVPFSYLLGETLSLRFLPAWTAAMGVVALMAVPFFVGPAWRRTAQLSLLAVGLAQFFAVWIPSLASQVSDLGARLLSPTIALLILTTLHGLQTAWESLSPRRWSLALLLLPFGFLALGRDIVPGELLSVPGRVNYPVEMGLWRELHGIEWIQSSTHFYSDRDFVHQIFAGIPQRIFWDTSVLRDAQAVRALLATGRAPFILLRQGSWEAGAVEELMASGQVPLEKITFPRYGFVLYYPPDQTALPGHTTSWRALPQWPRRYQGAPRLAPEGIDGRRRYHVRWPRTGIGEMVRLPRPCPVL